MRNGLGNSFPLLCGLTSKTEVLFYKSINTAGGEKIARRTTETKVKVDVRIPQDTFDWIIKNNYTATEAVNKALDRWFYKKARFVNLRLEDIRFINRLDELEKDYIENRKMATAEKQK